METHNSDNLPLLINSTLPKGGLAALHSDSDDPLGNYGDNAEAIFLQNNITTFNGLVGLVLMMTRFGDKAVTLWLFAEGWRRGIVTKEQLAQLYLSQDLYVRIGPHPILKLDDMWQIPVRAQHRSTGKEHTLAIGFTQEEIIGLANQVLDIHPSDVGIFFGQWFYNSNKPLPFSKEFLLNYYDHRGYSAYKPSGKLGALIAIALFNTYPGEVSEDDVLNQARSLAYIEPESHGIFRYISLAFAVAGDDERKRKRVIDGWVDIISTLIHQSNSSLRVELAVEMFVHDKSLPQKEKVVGLQKITDSLRAKASGYLTLARKVRKVLPAKKKRI
ncbi:MAG: hypothetical protein RIQ41_126 [Candidatus Parcubacteria bacterium]